MFRRSQKTAEPQPEQAVKPGGKGRPTPTRKEAEAAARARAKAQLSGKEGRKADRQRRMEANARMREGMRTGDERFLPARDQGPVRRFIRDYVDARLCVGEFLLPLLIVLMVMQSIHNPSVQRASTDLWFAIIVLTAADTLWMLWRLRGQLKTRFPDEETRGTSFYAIMRMLQLRPMRMPRANVGLGGRPKRKK
ncbi:MAG TPA: DUF3043 domain-containing protein [Marmoricola sp.]|nr:DUF3043 domain-containing protein [Marmoricola sp.]